jgi:hypothetical protein
MKKSAWEFLGFSSEKDYKLHLKLSYSKQLHTEYQYVPDLSIAHFYLNE